MNAGIMPNKLAYDTWRFIVDYPRRRRDGTVFQREFASFLERKAENYVIVARFDDLVKGASGVSYKPDILAYIKESSNNHTFISFECKTGNVDINVVTSFNRKMQDIAFKKRIVLPASGQEYPLDKLYRAIVSLRKPSDDALRYCFGFGVETFYRARPPEDPLPPRAVIHRLSIFSPKNPNDEQAKTYLQTELETLAEKTLKDARDPPHHYEDIEAKLRHYMYYTHTLVNGRWLV